MRKTPRGVFLMTSGDDLLAERQKGKISKHQCRQSGDVGIANNRHPTGYEIVKVSAVIVRECSLIPVLDDNAPANSIVVSATADRDAVIT